MPSAVWAGSPQPAAVGAQGLRALETPANENEFCARYRATLSDQRSEAFMSGVGVVAFRGDERGSVWMTFGLPELVIGFQPMMTHPRVRVGLAREGIG